MATNSKIEWTDHTFNPWRGCTKVSAGCAHCYAETMSKRNPKSLGIWGDNGLRVIASESGWREPLKWDREAEASGVRARVFCGSMCDICEDRPELHDPRARLIRTIAATPNLDWLLLSKRPEHYLRLFDRWLSDQWPCNVWAGTSVEDQASADARIPHLLRVPAAVRFLSVEPLLDAVCLDAPQDGWLMEFTDEDMSSASRMRVPPIHWVIVGGESGPNAWPCNVEWIRSIVKQCKAASVPCFVKQLGARPIWDGCGLVANNPKCAKRKESVNGEEVFMLLPKDKKGGEPSEWPEDLRVRQTPTAAERVTCDKGK